VLTGREGVLPRRRRAAPTPAALVPTLVAGLVLTLVLALLLAGCGSGPQDDPPPATPTGLGGTGPREPVLEAPLGAKWDWARYDQFAPYLGSLDGGPTFYEVVWCDVEPQPGEQDWGDVDSVVRRAVEVSGTVMLKLRIGQCWATGQEAQRARGSKTESAPPQDLEAYRAFVTSVVERYAPQGVHRYAVENEVNSPSFWAGTAQEYGDLAEVAAGAVRAADPRAVVLDSGPSSVAWGYGVAQRLLDEGRDDDAVEAWNTYFENRIGTRGRTIPRVEGVDDLRTALGTEQGERNLAALEVSQQLAQDGTTDSRQVHFYEPWQAAPLLFEHLRATTPDDVPLEVWEVGSFVRGQQVPAQESADQTVRTVSSLLALGASVVVWLPLAFDPGGRNPDEPRTGLLEPDGEVRPSGEVYRELAEAAAGATPVPVDAGGVMGVGFDRPEGSVAFVWAADDRVEVAAAGGADVGAEPTRLELDGSVDDLVESLS